MHSYGSYGVLSSTIQQKCFADAGCTLNASTWIVILVDLSVRPLATNTIAIHQHVRSQSRGSWGQLALLICMRH